MCYPGSISSLSHLTCANENIDVERKGPRTHARDRASARRHAGRAGSEVISALTCGAGRQRRSSVHGDNVLVSV